MQEMELYHVHVLNNNDNKWKVNNTLKIDDKFNSIMAQRQASFSQLLQVSDDTGNIVEKQVFDQYLAYFYENIKDKHSLSGKDLELMKQLLLIARHNSFNANFFKREASLEDCRKDNYSDLPSRLHSVYLCDKDGIEYWSDVLRQDNGNKPIEVFRVVACDKVFKTNEQLMPAEESTYGESYHDAFKYWHPKFGKVANYTNEYLAQGTIKIIEKVR